MMMSGDKQEKQKVESRKNNKGLVAVVPVTTSATDVVTQQTSFLMNMNEEEYGDG